jgi:hypothetical protein
MTAKHLQHRGAASAAAAQVVKTDILPRLDRPSRGVGSIRSSPWPLGITWILDGREVTIVAPITANVSAAMSCRAVSIPWASSRKGSTPSRSGDRSRHVVSPVGIEGSAAHENYL